MGLGDVNLVEVDDLGEGAPLVVVIRSRRRRPVCEGCGGQVWSKGYRTVVLEGAAGVRAAGSAAVAEATLDVPESRMLGGVVHRTGSGYWGGACVVDIPSRPVGNRPGQEDGSHGR